MKLWQSSVEFTVKAGQSHTAEEAMKKIDTFATLCTTYKATIVDTCDDKIVLRARPKNAANFQRDHAVLSLIGAV